jgi:hypothetical protein
VKNEIYDKIYGSYANETHFTPLASKDEKDIYTGLIKSGPIDEDILSHFKMSKEEILASKNKN